MAAIIFPPRINLVNGEAQKDTHESQNRCLFFLIGISVRMGGYEDLGHHGNSRRINRVLTMALKEGDA